MVQPMRAGDRFAADVRTFLGHVGATGLPLTDTRRLRLADVREINSRLVEPEELDQRIGERIFRLRTEDEAWRVSFIRLVCEAAGLIKTRHGRLSLTTRGRRVATAWPPDAVRQLFRAWWWRGEWELGGGHGWIDGVLAMDRAATARALRALGAGDHGLEALGDHLRGQLKPPTVVPLPDQLLEGSTWGYAAWHSCLRILSVFGGCELHREDPGDRYSSISSFTILEEGIALLDDALAHEAELPVRSPSVRRERPARTRLARASTALPDIDDVLAALERQDRVRSWHPGYAVAIDRGEEMVDGVNARLHLLLHEAVEEQIDGEEPPIVHATYERLAAGGHDPHEVRHMLARAVAQEIETIQREQTPFDAERLARRLADLPGSWTAAAEPERLRPPRLGRRDLARLRRLPRTGGIWEGGVRDLPVEIADQPGPTLGAVWVETATGLTRGMTADIGVPRADLLLRSFVNAALRPERAGGRLRPALPVRIRVPEAHASKIRSALAPLSISTEAASELPALDHVFASFMTFLDAEGVADDDLRLDGDLA